jgi:glyoxylase-like metal-dependent hydrolase (beta-lactamase superfamily II)
MRVHHINCATLCPLGGRFLGGEGGLFSSGRLVCHCLVIEGPGGLILVDTGVGLEDIHRPSRLGRGFLALVRPRLDPAEAAVAQLARLGFSASDVRDVVLTHLDPDHAGALADFPQATVHVYEPEYRAAMAPSLSEAPRYRAEQWAHGAAWWPHRPTGGDRWFGLDCVRQLEGLPPEVLFVPLVGHTRGHAGVAVEGDDGWLLHAGDAYFSRREVRSPGEGARLIRAFEYLDAFDNRARLDSRQRLRRLVGEHGRQVRVFCSHDPVELAEFEAQGVQAPRDVAAAGGPVPEPGAG